MTHSIKLSTVQWGRTRCLQKLICACISVVLTGSLTATAFDFRPQILGPAQSLSLFVEEINATTGAIRVNGVDTRQPGVPFTWSWGDGLTTTGFFPQTHTYSNRGTNYPLRVTAHYGGGQTGVASVVVRFLSPQVRYVSLASELSVTVADRPQPTFSRLPGYTVPSQLTWFPEALFSTVPRVAIEHVLSAAAMIQADLINQDFHRPGGEFRQRVLRDPSSSGALYSLWYTAPIAWAAPGNSVSGNSSWSSFFHEMGHNFSLNSPANYPFGGRIDGNASAIVTEGLAQILQHATAYELVNRAAAFGIDAGLASDIQNSAVSTMNQVRSAHQRYLVSRVFNSWNNPATAQDETMDTFMTVAFKFFEHAEMAGKGYRQPTQRLMQAMQLFNADWHARYDPRRDSATGAMFRATMWVAALSHAFQQDLRSEFRALNFPISNPVFEEIEAATRVLSDPAGMPLRLEVRGFPGLIIEGQPSRLYQIEYTPALPGSNWQVLSNVLLTSSPHLWIDHTASNQHRYYRARQLE